MFKKLVLFFSALTVSAVAHAAPYTSSDAAKQFFFKPYVGLGYQNNDFGEKGQPLGGDSDDYIDTNLHGGNIYLGARFHKYWAVEAAYQRSEEAKQSNVLGLGVDSKARISGGSVDLLGYLPINPKLDVIGTVGITRLKGEVEYSGGIGSYDETETKWRAGAGLQYALTDRLNARGLVRYQEASFDNLVDDAVVSTVGLNWEF